MKGGAPPRRRSGIVAPAIAVSLVVAGLIGLGKWQLDRRVWKEALINTLDQRLSAAPSDLPPRERWPSLNPAADEYSRVRFAAEFAQVEPALVFTSGSTFRPDVSGPGYWVFAPARLAGGGSVVVDRGFVPEGRQNEALRLVGVAARIDVVGVMRWPEQAGWFTPNPDPAHNLWFMRDPSAIARAKNWGEVAPFFVEQESPVPAEGLPLPGPLKVNLPDDHLQYAITWFGLAAVVAGSFAFWLRSRLREGQGARAGG